jgi:hypothetical protein
MFKKLFLFVAITIHGYAMEFEKQKHCNEINRIQPNSSINEFKEGHAVAALIRQKILLKLHIGRKQKN